MYIHIYIYIIYMYIYIYTRMAPCISMHVMILHGKMILYGINIMYGEIVYVKNGNGHNFNMVLSIFNIKKTILCSFL